MSQLYLSDLFEYLCYRSTAIINISINISYSAGIDFRRQILTSKIDPRAVRVKELIRMCSGCQGVRDVDSMLIQCWPTVCEVGPTLNQH